MHLPVGRLDVGYSLDLQSKAWRSRDYAAAISHMLADAVQDEVDGIMEAAEGTSLEVERTHFLYQRGVGQRGVLVTKVARASKNSLFGKCRTRRNPLIAKSIKGQTEWRKLQHMNIRAVAIQKMPHLMPRSRGKYE